MGDVAIKFENVSKQYRLGLVSTRTLSHDLKRWWITNVLGKEDPYLTIGETNDRSTKGESEYIWALKDIDFEVKKGEVLGIIGKNGAGKSTLLKILSRVTSPTTGCIHADGRIASLLEVGTGFHPELTGRENIFMNGAIMGMTNAEITRKMDEIVDFSGCERYIDTPVKRYSSGMTVRLGFAIAAHLEPEILVVDEVLAVGDAEFQKKAIGKMKEVSNGDGRTILFVSHNMGAVSRLCNKVVLLKNGKTFNIGAVNDIIEQYISDNVVEHAFYNSENEKLPTQIQQAELLNNQNILTSTFTTQDIIKIKITIKNISNEKGIRCDIGIIDSLDNFIMIDRLPVGKSKHMVILGELLSSKLLPGRFRVSVALDIPGYEIIEVLPTCLVFNIIDKGIKTTKQGDTENGIVASFINWIN